MATTCFFESTEDLSDGTRVRELATAAPGLDRELQHRLKPLGGGIFATGHHRRC